MQTSVSKSDRCGRIAWLWILWRRNLRLWTRRTCLEDVVESEKLNDRLFALLWMYAQVGEAANRDSVSCVFPCHHLGMSTLSRPRMRAVRKCSDESRVAAVATRQRAAGESPFLRFRMSISHGVINALSELNVCVAGSGRLDVPK